MRRGRRNLQRVQSHETTESGTSESAFCGNGIWGYHPSQKVLEFETSHSKCQSLKLGITKITTKNSSLLEILTLFTLKHTK